MAFRIITDNPSCPVCQELCKNPKYLPCSHSYGITYPECRREVVLSSEGVKGFAKNLLMTCLVDKLILNQKVNDEVEAKYDKDDPVVYSLLS